MSIARYNPPMSVGGAMIPNDDGHWCYHRDVERELEARDERVKKARDHIAECLGFLTADVDERWDAGGVSVLIEEIDYILKESK